ncbi:1801_t:CDS:1, partial [Ambispora leptoticha]
ASNSFPILNSDSQPEEKLPLSTSNTHELHDPFEYSNSPQIPFHQSCNESLDSIVDGPYLTNDYHPTNLQPETPFSKNSISQNLYNFDNLYDVPQYVDLSATSQTPKPRSNTAVLIKRLKLEKPVKGQRLLTLNPLFGASEDDDGGNTSTETVVSFRDSSSTETSDTVVNNGMGKGLKGIGKEKVEQIRGKNKLVSPSEIEN